MASFQQKVQNIPGRIAAGETLGANNQAWYERWIASGSPTSQSGMMSPTQYSAPAPEAGGVDPAFTTELLAINERFDPADKTNIDMDVFNNSTANDPRARYQEALKATNPDMIQADEAQQQVRDLLTQYGYTDAASLETQNKGSGTNTYMNLGSAGNGIYNTGAYNPSGGGSNDVVTVGNRDGRDSIGQSSLGEKGKDPSIWNTKGFQIGASLLAPFTGGASVAVQKALAASDGQTLHREDAAQIAAAVAGGQLSKVGGGFGDVYNAPNVGGSLLRGVSAPAIGQAVEGDLDLEALAKAGVINVGADVLGDVYGDARQTNDGSLLEGVDTVNGNVLSAEDVTRLQNTTDAYGILGQEGLLAKMGINVPTDTFLTNSDGYLRTGLLGDGLDLIGQGGRQFVNEDIANESKWDASDGVERMRSDRADELYGQLQSGELSGDAYLEAISENTQWATAQGREIDNQFLRDTSRYDERFFDITSERSDVPLTGIYENKRGSSSGSALADTAAAAENTQPSYDSSITPITDEAFSEFMASNPTASLNPSYGTGEGELQGDLPSEGGIEQELTSSILAEDGDLNGTVSPFTDGSGVGEGELTLGGYERPATGSAETFEDLQGSGVGEGELTLGGYEQGTLPSGGSEVTLPSGGSEDTLPSADIEDIVPSTSDTTAPSSGGGGGGGGTPRERIKKVAKQLDDELFRLARVMQVLPMNELQKVSLQQRMREIQGQRQSLAYDATAILDPQSSEYIQKVKEGEEDASNIVDPIQQAIEATA